MTSDLETEREGLFWFQCFINLSLAYLLMHVQPRDTHMGQCILQKQFISNLFSHTLIYAVCRCVS